MLEGELYKHTLPHDYIVHLHHKSTANNVHAAFTMHHKIDNWVKKSILRPDDVGKRGETLRFFVQTADVSHGFVFSTCVE
jgi:hypothetical protein